MDTEELVKELARVRRRLKLTQRQAAERMGSHVSFVQRIEGNKGDRQVSHLFRYADALGVQIGFYVINEPKEITGL